jgi:outer membrane protein W
MKIKSLLLVAIIAMSFVANAQIKLGAGLGLAMPMGDFLGKNYANVGMGFGLNVTGTYMLNDNIGVGAGVGYYSMANKDDSKAVLKIVPIVGNATYYFAGDAIKPYVGLDLGIYSVKFDYDGTNLLSISKIGFAPTVGAEYGLNDMLSLNANLKYNYIMGDKTKTDDKAVTPLTINVGVIYKMK